MHPFFFSNFRKNLCSEQNCKWFVNLDSANCHSVHKVAAWRHHTRVRYHNRFSDEFLLVLKDPIPARSPVHHRDDENQKKQHPGDRRSIPHFKEKKSLLIEKHGDADS